MTDVVSEQIESLRERMDLIWAAHEREHKAHEAAHTREHELSSKAIDTAATLAAQNKADSNEWRSAMSDRERTFATKVDIGTLGEKIVSLERAEIRRVETERLRLIEDTEEKRQAERRTSRGQWAVGIVIGLSATFGSILVNLALR